VLSYCYICDISKNVLCKRQQNRHVLFSKTLNKEIPYPVKHEGCAYGSVYKFEKGEIDILTHSFTIKTINNITYT